MAIPKDKVQGKFTEKFKKLNLPKTFKDSQIKKIADSLDSEDEVDARLDLLEPILSDAAADLDRERTELARKKKTDEPAPDDDVIDESVITDPGTKSLLKMLTKLTSEVTELKASKNAEGTAERFKKDERLKDIPAFAVNRSLPKSDEEYEQAVEALVTDYAAYAKEVVISKVGEDAPDRSGKGAKVGEKAVNDEIANWAKTKVEQQKAQQATQ